MERKDEFLRVCDIARIAGVSPETVKRWIETGELTAFDAGTEQYHQYRVSPQAWSRFQANRDPASGGAPGKDGKRARDTSPLRRRS